jgi:hypothetical protein
MVACMLCRLHLWPLPATRQATILAAALFSCTLLQITPSVFQVNGSTPCSNTSFFTATNETSLSHKQQQQQLHNHTRGSTLTSSSNTSDPLAGDLTPALLNGSNSSSRDAPVQELVQLPRPDPADADRMFRQDLLVLFTPKAAGSVSPVANSTEW